MLDLIFKNFLKVKKTIFNYARLSELFACDTSSGSLQVKTDVSFWIGYFTSLVVCAVNRRNVATF